jgi:hypothetical protein
VAEPAAQGNSWFLARPVVAPRLSIRDRCAHPDADRLLRGRDPQARPRLCGLWWKTVTVGPWHSGPAWFIGALLVFDVLAAIVYRAAPILVEAIGELSLGGLRRPRSSFRTLLIGSIIAFVPAELYFGAARWLAIGPLAIQASRILLYLLYSSWASGSVRPGTNTACSPRRANWRSAGRLGSQPRSPASAASSRYYM